MKRKISYHLIILLCSTIVFSCGKEPGPEPIYLNGTVGGDVIVDHLDKSIMVAAVKGDNLLDSPADAFSDPSTMMDNVVDYISIDKTNMSFSMDLTEKGVTEGDELALIAFVDVNESSSLPYPNKGDFMGFYTDEKEMTYTYKLKKGLNEGVHIDITREIFDFNASIEGTVSGEDMGNIMIIAYSGEITSLDLSSAIDFDGVIGFAQIEKTRKTQEFTIDILPFGKNVPIKDVCLFAILDKNNNDKPDGGDLIGFLPDEDNMPASITVEEGVITLMDKEIALTMELFDPSGYDVPLKGTIEMPEGECFHKDSPPLYLVLVSADNLTSFSSFSSFSDDLLNIVKYFTKITSTLPADQGVSSVDFQVDLSNSSLKAGDEIMVAAFWDKDHVTGFPKPTENDRFGFYNNKEDLAVSIALKDRKAFSETDTDIVNVVPSLEDDEFRLNKIWYEHQASVKYRLEAGALDGNYDAGDQILVAAFQRDGLELEFQDLFPIREISIDDIISIDIDYLVGFQMLEIDSNTFDPDQYFNLELMPFQLEGLVSGPGFDHIDEVGIFAAYGMELSDLSIQGIRHFGYYFQPKQPYIFLNLSNMSNYCPENMANRGIKLIHVPSEH